MLIPGTPSFIKKENEFQQHSFPFFYCVSKKEGGGPQATAQWWGSCDNHLPNRQAPYGACHPERSRKRPNGRVDPGLANKNKPVSL